MNIPSFSTPPHFAATKEKLHCASIRTFCKTLLDPFSPRATLKGLCRAWVHLGIYVSGDFMRYCTMQYHISMNWDPAQTPVLQYVSMSYNWKPRIPRKCPFPLLPCMMKTGFIGYTTQTKKCATMQPPRPRRNRECLKGFCCKMGWSLMSTMISRLPGTPQAWGPALRHVLG